MQDRPLLVIVGGAPATGKTTLAAELGADLGLPVLTRDGLKETLMDALGAPDRARSSEIGGAAYAVLYDVVGRLLEASVGAVIESNFYRGRSDQDLLPLAERANAVLLHCEAPREVIERRYEGRFTQGLRHPGHHDMDALPSLLDNLERGVYEPLELGVPTLRVNTADGYNPSLPEMLAFILTAYEAIAPIEPEHKI